MAKDNYKNDKEKEFSKMSINRDVGINGKPRENIDLLTFMKKRLLHILVLMEEK